MPGPRFHSTPRFVCPHVRCDKSCRSPGGLQRHINAVHTKRTPLQPQLPDPPATAPNEDDVDMEHGHANSPAPENDMEPPLRAVTHHHPILDG